MRRSAFLPEASGFPSFVPVASVSTRARLVRIAVFPDRWSSTTHDIVQGGGWEHGSPIMPSLFALAQRDSHVQADQRLVPSDRILSSWAICASSRPRPELAQSFSLLRGPLNDVQARGPVGASFERGAEQRKRPPSILRRWGPARGRPTNPGRKLICHFGVNR